MIFGYLRETRELAQKAGIDKTFNLCRTGLEDYLKVIFPNINDWIHDKSTGIIELGRVRPDYRSESLKMIIEFDGLPHYTNPIQIRKDKERTLKYQKYGYKVIRIPYFIQLTKQVVKTLFNVNISYDLFNPNLPSLSITENCSPAFLCIDGIKRMAEEFHRFPEQYKVNLHYLKSIPKENQYLARADLLEYFYNKSEREE